MGLPVTRYAKSGDVHIAWQTLGEGPIDLVFVPGWVSHVEAAWRFPEIVSFLRKLARMDDVRAVLDAAGVRYAVLFGASEGVSLSILFAATYPERTLRLVAYGGFARRKRTPDYPWAPSDEALAFSPPSGRRRT
jgi:pimeloyl-ACP methyl ester carboxylesterase